MTETMFQTMLKNFSDVEKKEIIQKMMDEYFVSHPFELVKCSKIPHYIDRSKFKEKQDKCEARIWNGGYGGQCSRKQHRNQLCSKHYDILCCQGSLWLGYTNGPRPEHPIYKGPKGDQCIHKQWKNVAINNL